MNQSPATWNTLPIEIRDRILYFYCAEVINEYTQLTADIRVAYESSWNFRAKGSDTVGAAARFVKDGTWTKHIDYLPKFSEVLRLSRYFHQTISEFIKIDTKSALETLRELHQDRATTVFLLAETLEMDNGDEKLSFDFIPKLAGDFMKDASAVRTPPFDYVFRLPQVAVLTIPRIEEWVLQQVRPIRVHQQLPITLSYYECNADGHIVRSGELELMPGELQVAGNRLVQFDVISIARPARLSDCYWFDICHRTRYERLCVDPLPDLLMVREILSSKPGSTWWLFTRTDARFTGTSHRWILVNWKEKKMFKYPDMTTGIIWDDSWDETNWRRYRDDHAL